MLSTVLGAKDIKENSLLPVLKRLTFYLDEVCTDRCMQSEQSNMYTRVLWG